MRQLQSKQVKNYSSAAVLPSVYWLFDMKAAAGPSEFQIYCLRGCNDAKNFTSSLGLLC